MEKEALQPNEIQCLSEGLVQANIVLDVRLLFVLIILFVDYLRESSDKSKQTLALISRDRARRLCEQALGRTTINTDRFNRYLTGEIKKHQEYLTSTELCATHALRSGRQGVARYLTAEVAGVKEHVKRLEELQRTLPEGQAEVQ